MPARASKSALLYAAVRLAIQTGRYLPGDHIDPGMLAAEFKASPTPVRFALYRLVGEGMIADHGRQGFDIPIPTEASLRSLYDWMRRLLLMACEISLESPAMLTSIHAVATSSADVVALTRQTFESFALETGHHFLHLAVRQANDKLDPIRRAKQPLVPDARQELARLIRLGQRRQVQQLKAALVDYHERRMRLVPQIVGVLNSRRTSN
jgi:DNA-binding GntR family transcriptional regulator